MLFVDEHPLLFKEKGRSKEGFSLFSILDRTVSLPGLHLIFSLKRWDPKITPFFKHMQDDDDFEAGCLHRIIVKPKFWTGKMGSN